MKKFILSLCIIAIGIIQTNNLFAQKTIDAKSKIKNVTVYTQSAQIIRNSTVNIPEGASEIRISGLSQFMDPNSLRVTGKGAFVIMSQDFQIKYPTPEKVEEEGIPSHIQKKILILNDSIEQIVIEIQVNNAKKEVLVNEKNFLQSSQAITKTDTITELKDALAYYRERMTDINNEWFKLMKRERFLLKEKSNKEERLVVLQNFKRNKPPAVINDLPEGEVTISVMADKAIYAAELELSYVTSQASWVPMYDLRVQGVDQAVRIVMSAQLRQSTGEKWENVKLTFSTGKATVYKQLPVLPVWYVNYYMPQRSTNTGSVALCSKTDSKAEKDMELDEVYAMPVSAYTQHNESLISSEYSVSIPYTIPSDGRMKSITIMDEPLAATYRFFAIPKIDKDVFLTAYLTGWEKLDLIPGQANIVYQNSIISRTYIDPATVNDTLLLSLGADERIQIERKKLSEKSKDKIIGSMRERTVHFELTVKNKHQTSIDLVLKDQIPVSQQENIKVSLEEVSGGKYNEDTGEIEWRMKLKANEIKKVQFRYIIKYDKNKTVLTE